MLTFKKQQSQLIYQQNEFVFPQSSVGKESACDAGDLGLISGSIPASGRSPVEGIGYPLQHSCASLVAQLVKNSPAMQETWVYPWVQKIPWRTEKLPTQAFWPGEFHGLSPWGHKESNTPLYCHLHEQYSLQLKMHRPSNSLFS